MIEVQDVDILKYTADAEMLTEEFAAYSEDIAVWFGDIKALTKAQGSDEAIFGSIFCSFSVTVSIY